VPFFIYAPPVVLLLAPPPTRMPGRIFSFSSMADRLRPFTLLRQKRLSGFADLLKRLLQRGKQNAR